MRYEEDFLGKIQLSEDALYGIHSLRAKNNFPDTTPFHIEWYQAVADVKLACYQTYQKFKRSAEHKINDKAVFCFIDDRVLNVLIEAVEELSGGAYFKHFIVPAVQGGAGTSINMNINEIITNVALKKIGEHPGSYHIIDPIEDANVYQSTNDVIPTALTVASMRLLYVLEDAVNNLRNKVETVENKYRNVLRISYTQMQAAVPSTYGKLFSSYSEALSRDWWRVSKCSERIKVVNLGGSAVGTSIAIPRYFVMEVVSCLQQLTKLPVSRSENLPDATSNTDSIVEVHAILKSLAVNLEKIASDLRLLAADVVHEPELKLPQKQTGSSIMPGKVNPVIVEYIVSVAHKVYSNDQLVTSLCSQGCLELNAYLPMIGHALLESIKLLISACNTMGDNLFQGLTVNKELAESRLFTSPAITTALTPYIGYNKAALLAKEMKKSDTDIFKANKILNLLEEEKLNKILDGENLMKSGFSIYDL